MEFNIPSVTSHVVQFQPRKHETTLAESLDGCWS